MSTTRNALLLIVGMAAVASATCDSVPLTAPPGSTLALQANPMFVPANGGVSVVTAIVIEPAGTFVPNGTEVFFFTTLGRIDERVKTVDGIARANFVSDARSGTAHVSAYSGGSTPPSGGGTSTSTTSTTLTSPVGSGNGTDRVDIIVGSALPARVIVGADPQRITSPRRATIVANVFDGSGNPVQNVPVVFTLAATPLEESLSSGGSPQYTDSNGQAFDTLVTRALAGIGQKAVTVTATTANGIQGTVTVYVD